MATGDDWYFLRGDQTVGPLSRESLLQSHFSGQVTLETPVWREGMGGWEPAGSIPGLLFNAPDPDAAKVTIQTSKRDSKPSMAFTKTTARLSLSKAVHKGDEVAKRESRRIQIATLLASLFMIVMGAMAWFYQTKFPNVAWFPWIAMGMGGCGVLSLLGLRVLDGFFRLLALVLLGPALMLFWPVLMGDVSWKAIPDAYYVFLAYSILYCLTIRIGLRDYVLQGATRIAMLTGGLTVGFTLCTIFSIWSPAGWSDLVQNGDSIRLPGILAQAFNHPEWGTRVGMLELPLPEGDIKHPIETAVYRRDASGANQFTLKTLDGIKFQVPITQSGSNLSEILNRDWPIILPMRRIEESDRLELMVAGKVVPVVSASLRIERIENGFWEGSLQLQLGRERENVSSNAIGAFKARVTDF